MGIKQLYTQAELASRILADKSYGRQNNKSGKILYFSLPGSNLIIFCISETVKNTSAHNALSLSISVLLITCMLEFIQVSEIHFSVLKSSNITTCPVMEFETCY